MPDEKNGRESRKNRRRMMNSAFRSIRAGTASTIRGTKRAAGAFDTFTHAEQATGAARSAPTRWLNKMLSKTGLWGILAIALVFVLVLVAYIQNSVVNVDRQYIYVVGLEQELEGYNILHISDLHGRTFGESQRSLLRTIGDLSYQMVVFSGDMVGASGNPQPFYDILEGLPASRPKFFIPGDSDPPIFVETPRGEGKLENVVLADWVLGAQERGAKLLSYTQSVTVSGRRIWLSPQSMMNVNLLETVRMLEEQMNLEKMGVISGLESSKKRLPVTNYRYNAALLSQKASAEMGGSDVHVAVTHMPPSDAFLQTARQRGEEDTIAYLPAVDIILSGHYCGGGSKAPFGRAVYIPDDLAPKRGWLPNPRDVDGKKTVGLSTQYTSAGLGTTDKIALLDWRLFNPPTISVLTLTAEVTNDLVRD